MFRQSVRECRIGLAAVFAFLGPFSASGRSQEAQAVNVQFAFRLPAVDTRFEKVSKSDVEKNVSAELARSCAKQFPFWTFQPTGANLPRLDVWLSLKNSTWSLSAALAHTTGKELKDKWSTVLYAPGDLDTQVLPKDRAWTAKIKAAFETLLEGENQNELLKALEEFAPLGDQMATVPAQFHRGTPP